MMFIDFEKAFDSIKLNCILKALKNSKINETYIQLIKYIYNYAKASIKINQYAETISLRKGIRQGDALSSKLFNAALREIMKSLGWQDMGIRIGNDRLTHLRYADDVVLLGINGREVEKMMNQLRVISEKNGLKINAEKTKVMYNKYVEKTDEIKINNVAIETVDAFIYLGHNIIANNDMKNEVKRSIQRIWAAIDKLKNLLEERKIPMCLKRKVFNQCVLPVMVYVTETWSITKGNLERINKKQRRNEWKMLGITLQDKVEISEMRRRTKVKDAAREILKSKWRWAGHIARSNDNRWTARSTKWHPMNKKERCRPRTR